MYRFLTLVYIVTLSFGSKTTNKRAFLKCPKPLLELMDDFEDFDDLDVLLNFLCDLELLSDPNELPLECNRLFKIHFLDGGHVPVPSHRECLVIVVLGVPNLSLLLHPLGRREHVLLGKSRSLSSLVVD